MLNKIFLKSCWFMWECYKIVCRLGNLFAGLCSSIFENFILDIFRQAYLVFHLDNKTIFSICFVHIWEGSLKCLKIKNLWIIRNSFPPHHICCSGDYGVWKDITLTSKGHLRQNVRFSYYPDLCLTSSVWGSGGPMLECLGFCKYY